MELRQLHIFCAAAETLNFTQAAAQLGYAQSNITSQIKKLEAELGTRLFERFGRHIQLTSEGQRFRQHACAIIEQCQRAKQELSPDSCRGTLTIGCVESLCVYRLPPILSAYRQKYPLVDIRVHTTDFAALIAMLRHNDLDVALALTADTELHDMAVTPLYQEPMSIVASPAHRLAQLPHITPQNLDNECLITSVEGGAYSPLFTTMLERYKVHPCASMELASVGAIKECTACGLGYTMLPRIAVQADIACGRLAELNWQGPHFDIRTQVIHHEHKWLSPIITAFLALCPRMGQ